MKYEILLECYKTLNVLHESDTTYFLINYIPELKNLEKLLFSLLKVSTNHNLPFTNDCQTQLDTVVLQIKNLFLILNQKDEKIESSMSEEEENCELNEEEDKYCNVYLNYLSEAFLPLRNITKNEEIKTELFDNYEDLVDYTCNKIRNSVMEVTQDDDWNSIWKYHMWKADLQKDQDNFKPFVNTNKRPLKNEASSFVIDHDILYSPRNPIIKNNKDLRIGVFGKLYIDIYIYIDDEEHIFQTHDDSITKTPSNNFLYKNFIDLFELGVFIFEQTDTNFSSLQNYYCDQLVSLFGMLRKNKKKQKLTLSLFLNSHNFCIQFYTTFNLVMKNKPQMQKIIVDQMKIPIFIEEIANYTLNNYTLTQILQLREIYKNQVANESDVLLHQNFELVNKFENGMKILYGKTFVPKNINLVLNSRLFDQILYKIGEKGGENIVVFPYVGLGFQFGSPSVLYMVIYIYIYIIYIYIYIS